MDEETAQIESLVDSMAKTTTEAYKKRFQENNSRSFCIIINSLFRSLVFFLDHVDSATRNKYIFLMNLQLLEADWTQDSDDDDDGDDIR